MVRTVSLLRALRDTRGARLDLLAARLHSTETRVQHALEAALFSGLVVGNHGRWSLTPTGRELLARIDARQHSERHEALAWMMRTNCGSCVAA